MVQESTGVLDALRVESESSGQSMIEIVSRRLAESYGLNLGDAIAVIANAHAISASPVGITVEIDQTRTPFIDELIGRPLTVTDGTIWLGKAPGLGIELDDDVLERYRLPDPLDLPAGSYSDMMFGRQHLPPVLPYIEAGA